MKIEQSLIEEYKKIFKITPNKKDEKTLYAVHFLVNILSVVNGGRSGTDCLFENDVKYTKRQYQELREWFYKLANKYKHIKVVDDSVLQPTNSYQIYNKKLVDKDIIDKMYNDIGNDKEGHTIFGKFLGYQCPTDIIQLWKKNKGKRIRIHYDMEVWLKEPKKLLNENSVYGFVCGEKQIDEINLKKLVDNKNKIQEVADKIFPDNKVIIRLTIETNDHKGLWF